MDKLELDDRVARLERRVSALTLTILFFGLLAGLSVIFMFRARSEGYIQPPQVATPLPAPMVTETQPEGMRQLPDMSEGSVGRLIKQLRDLSELNKKSMLTPTEFQEKKKHLLNFILHSTDFKAEIEELSQLENTGVLTPAEFLDAKANVLGIRK